MIAEIKLEHDSNKTIRFYFCNFDDEFENLIFRFDDGAFHREFSLDATNTAVFKKSLGIAKKNEYEITKTLHAFFDKNKEGQYYIERFEKLCENFEVTYRYAFWPFRYLGGTGGPQTNLPPEIEEEITTRFLETFKKEYLKLFKNRTLRYGFYFDTEGFYKAFEEACVIEGKSKLLDYYRRDSQTTPPVSPMIEGLMIGRGVIPEFEIDPESGFPLEIYKHLTNEFLTTFTDESNYYENGFDFGTTRYDSVLKKSCEKHNCPEVFHYYIYEFDDHDAFGATLEFIIKQRGILSER